MALVTYLGKVGNAARTAAGNHRNGYRLCNSAGQFNVIPFKGAVAVNGGQQEFPRAGAFHLPGSLNRIKSCGMGSGLGTYLITAVAPLLEIQRNNHTLAAETVCSGPDKFGIGDGCGVHHNTVRAGFQ